MEFTARIARQLVLLSMLLVIVPMIGFPESFGTELVQASLVYAFYEIVFYGIFVYLWLRRGRLTQLAQAAAMCLTYRLALGAVFGFLITVMYSLQLKVAMTLGIVSYLPVVMLQVAAAPFVLRPIWKHIFDGSPERRRVVPEARAPKAPEADDSGLTSIAVSRERGFSKAASRPEPADFSSSTNSPAPEANAGGDDGFDRATRYLGEDNSVKLAAVVDREGLLMACYRREDCDCEDHGPLPYLLANASRTIMSGYDWGDPESIRIDTATDRIAIATADRFSLLVVAERQREDVVGIRIKQAIEIIRKYVSERYSESLFEDVEIANVRSTQ